MVSDISFEDTENNGLSLHIFMRFSWVDNRLEVNRKAEESKNQIVTVNPKFMENIWVPDLFIYELQSFKRLELVKDISAGLKFIVHKNNDIGMKNTMFIIYTLKLFLEVFVTTDYIIVFTCPMDYSKFPFHVSTCRLKITSFNYFNDTIVFKMNPLVPSVVPPEKMEEGLPLHGYEVNMTFLSKEEAFAKSWFTKDGFYSCAGLRIELRSTFRKGYRLRRL